VWFHGASLGDVRALAPLVNRIAARKHPWLITAQTETGRSMARQLWPLAAVGTPPLDLPPFAGRALAAARPALLVLEYLELWPAWLAACARQAVPAVVVDGRVTQRSLRARRWLAPTARRLSWFCAQTEGDAERAAALGVPVDRISVTGNGKHDGVPADPPRPSAELRAAVGAVDLVVGSLNADEEGLALPALAASNLRLLLAPRHPERVASVLAWARRNGIGAARRSEGGSAEARWIVLDTVGELAAAYALAPVALVGGTFGARDGQNLVEPAAQGCLVVHGPRVANVAAEAAALAGHGALAVQAWPEAMVEVLRCLAEVGSGRAARPDPRAALAGLRGATDRHLAVIERWLPGASAGT
jgi:3-deoxy-D-manno-octulosonic-acid transferase